MTARAVEGRINGYLAREQVIEIALAGPVPAWVSGNVNACVTLTLAADRAAQGEMPELPSIQRVRVSSGSYPMVNDPAGDYVDYDDHVAAMRAYGQQCARAASCGGGEPTPSAGVEVTLYVDLDGVMADFDGAFPAVFGLDHRSLADDDMWLHINGHASFFRDLPPMDGAIEFFRSIEHLRPVILTACPKSNYAHVAAQKRAWVREHLSSTCLVLPVLGGRHKPLFMHQPGDILIDDFGKNCAAWTEAGGTAIKHEGDWTATRAALAAALGGGK